MDKQVAQLEAEAQAAKLTDFDLHQRKSKMMGKYREMIRSLQLYISLPNSHQKRQPSQRKKIGPNVQEASPDSSK
jgi:hypothetical protein